MRDVLLFAALGLGAGALIASIALGVVLIYRGSGVINVATGAIAMLAAYIFWALRTDYFGFQLSTAPAFVVTLACMAAFGVLIELAIFRPSATRLRSRSSLRHSVSCWCWSRG